MSKKKVVVQLPAVAREVPLEERYALELESLKDVAELVEVDSSSPATFIEGAKDADGIITSWGIRIDQQVIAGQTMLVLQPEVCGGGCRQRWCRYGGC